MRSGRVYTAGTFDLFHPGHVKFLRRCSFLGDVTVALNTDHFVSLYKGVEPVMNWFERRALLESCRYVKAVVRQPSLDLRPQLERLRPTYLAVGSDWAKKDYYAQIGASQEWLDEHDITLVYIPYTQNISTTDLRRRLGLHGRCDKPCKCRRPKKNSGKSPLPDEAA